MSEREPNLTLEQAQRRCAMAGVAPATSLRRLPKGEASASWQLHLADDSRAVLKLYWRRADAAGAHREAALLGALSRAGLPTAGWCHADDASLGCPSMLTAWLPGEDADAVFGRLNGADGMLLLFRVGRLLSQLHAVSTAALPAGLLAARRREAEDAEFAGALARLREQGWLPEQMLADSEGHWAASAELRGAARPEVLLHGDYQLWNLRVAPDSLEILGLLDLENAGVGPAYLDFRDLELNLFGDSPRLREAFRAGYGLDELSDDDEMHLRLTTLSRALSLLAAYGGAAPMVPRSVVPFLLDRLRG